jgi:hypothetical protein
VTVSAASGLNEVRFYQIHRWLNPIATERTTLFTHLEPGEIRDRLWPYWDHSYEPDTKKEFRLIADSLASFLTALPDLTEKERANRLEDLGRILRDGDADGMPLQGTAHPSGFKLWNERNSSVTLRATYRAGTHGTRLDVSFGLENQLQRLEHLFLSSIPVVIVVSSMLTGFVYPQSSLLPEVLFRLFLLLTFCILLMLLGIVVTTSILSKWLHRNDFATLKAFLADVIDAQEIENAP